jgi:dihydrofolate synthase / folylpolyglutamate synthase
MIEALLLAEGLRAGAYLSPHVHSWAERIRVLGREADLEAALAAVRRPAELLDATQFEVLTAAAFVSFRTAGVEAAVVEAGLGGRHDATNVLDATRVVVLTNVSLEHTDVLGDTREAIAAEKLAVVRPGCAVVLGEAEWQEAAREASAGDVTVASGGAPALALAAARAFLGREDVSGDVLIRVTLPGRLEHRAGEVRDGAHNPAGVRWLVEHLPPGDYTVMASILADKDLDEMLTSLARLGDRFVATTSSSPRALPSAELARRAARWFRRVEAKDDAREALALAHALGEPVLVTGSLYLLADLAAAEGAA